MSIDRSLKVKGALARHRNVLTRAERVDKLKDDEKWSEGDSVLGLPKVSHRKSHAGRKEKAAAAKETAVTEAVAGAVTEAAAATADKTAVKASPKAAAAKTPAKAPAAEPKPKTKEG
jgi:small basic protein (TIGR04137 family)